jgi:hypothetical protein
MFFFPGPSGQTLLRYREGCVVYTRKKKKRVKRRDREREKGIVKLKKKNPGVGNSFLGS